MTDFSKFLGDDQGAVTIDWVALTAGILLLGIMVVYAIFNGGLSGVVTDINATLSSLATDIDTGATPDLNGGGGDPMVLADGTSIPVGSKVAIIPDGSGGVDITFTDPNGTIIASGPISLGNAIVLDGATVSSATTLTLSDGRTVQVSDFGAPQA